MTPADSDNPYARQTAYGRMPQAPFRIGALPKAAPPKPAPLPPPRPAGVLSGSAIPLTPRREALPQPAPPEPARPEPAPAEPAPAEAEVVQERAPEPLVVPIASAPRPAPGKGRWFVAVLAAAGAAFLLLGRTSAPEPAPQRVVEDVSPAPAQESPPPAPEEPAAAVATATRPPVARPPVRSRAPVEKAAPTPAPPAVVETPAPEPPPVIAPPPVLNLPQTAPALREPLDPDAPIPGRTN